MSKWTISLDGDVLICENFAINLDAIPDLLRIAENAAAGPWNYDMSAIPEAEHLVQYIDPGSGGPVYFGNSEDVAAKILGGRDYIMIAWAAVNLPEESNAD